MPLYEFNCNACGQFTDLRPLSECAASAACPSCGAAASRIISVPRLAIMERTNRTAWERNERSVHEPRMAKAVHGHDHSHDRKGKHRHEQRGRLRGGRPWMLGH